MKKLSIFLLLFCSTIAVNAQDKEKPSQQPDPNKKLETVEASCGQCNFGLKGKGCSLAVRFNNTAYFVDGTNINEHGDAHSENGFCKAIRKANVQGKLVGNRYLVSYFQLLPEPVKKKQQN